MSAIGEIRQTGLWGLCTRLKKQELSGSVMSVRRSERWNVNAAAGSRIFVVAHCRFAMAAIIAWTAASAVTRTTIDPPEVKQ